MSDEALEAVTKLTAKLVVLESLVRTLVVESFLVTDDPIKNLRTYAARVEQSLTTAVPGGVGIPSMMIEAEIAEQFAVIEKWVRQATGN